MHTTSQLSCIALLTLSLAIAGCSTSGGGGSGMMPGPKQTVAAEGAPCTPVSMIFGCLINNNVLMQCDPADSLWKKSKDCAVGEVCTEGFETGTNKNTAQCTVASYQQDTTATDAGGTDATTGDDGGKSNKDGHKMVYVPAGSFWMGCNETKDKSCGSDEKPQHEVVLSSYWIDMYEVTVSDWGKCKAAGKCNDPEGTYSNCNWGKSGREQHPINCVAWSQARGYCQWLGGDYDLPTEAQWEKAARGGCEHNGGASGCKSGMRTYPWGEASPSCDLAVFDSGGGDGCGQDSTWAVGSKPKGVSPYGAHDMSGNVWEWVLDWYDKDYYGKLPKNDPVNNQSASSRVNRGGCWYYSAIYLRAGNRYYFDPAGDYSILGLRRAR